MSIVALIKLTAKPGKRQELLNKMTDAITATRAQPLCTGVELMGGIEDSNELLLIEQWPTVEAHENFINGVIEQGGLETIIDLLAKDIETTHFDSIVNY